MTLPSQKPVALVTGARRGLGLEAAIELARNGFDIIINDVSDDLTEATHAVSEAGARAHAISADISDVASLPEMVEQAWNTFGRLDCLVNNAGLAQRPLTDLLEVSPEQYDSIVNVNQRGTFFLTQAFALKLLESGPADPTNHRSIVTISSIASRMVSIDRAAYHLSKAALSMMNELFALRLAEHGIAAYEVRPGYMKTDMTGSATPAKLEEEILAGAVPAKRWGTPSDLGKTVATLATGQLPFSSGQAIWVDGGLHIHRAA